MNVKKLMWSHVHFWICLGYVYGIGCTSSGLVEAAVKADVHPPNVESINKYMPSIKRIANNFVAIGRPNLVMLFLLA